MGINYKFNTWQVSGEQGQEWSKKAYKLLSLNSHLETLSGWRIGAVLYFHQVKGMTASEIKKSPLGIGIPKTSIVNLLKEKPSKYATNETSEAKQLFYNMLETEPQMLDVLYSDL